MLMRNWAFLFSLILFLPSLRAEEKFPALRIQNITVSGISSGAFMAVQLQMALSEKIKGVAPIAGGIYGCAEGNSDRAQKICMKDPKKIYVKRYIQRTKIASLEKAIDNIKNLSGNKILLIQSKSDSVVKFESAKKLEDYFSEFLPTSQIKLIELDRVAHGFPTNQYGANCETGGDPHLLNCGIDMAGEILNYFYPNLSPPVEPVPNHLIPFEQSSYSAPSAELHKQGFIYLPSTCKSGSSCRLHIALHGCKMSPEFIGNQFSQYAGYNSWAEANNIVILYPAAKKSELNPLGCWDWWGYTGLNYATKYGAQIQAIQNMILSLSGDKPQR